MGVKNISGGLTPEVVYAILNGRIEASGATQEQVNTAVNKYLTDNPICASRCAWRN